MKTFEEFKKTVFECLENSHITPATIIEQETSITFTVPSQGKSSEHLRRLSARLRTEKIRFRSSVSFPSRMRTVSISVYNN